MSGKKNITRSSNDQSSVTISPAAEEFLREVMRFSPSDYRCLRNAVLGGPIAPRFYRNALALNARALLWEIHGSKEGDMIATPSSAGKTLYEVAVAELAKLPR